MANFTPNYNLKKPLGSENYNVADQNGNMDAIDTALNGIDNGLAIVSTGDTHGAITTGQFVYVRRHGSLAEGLYKANSNIAANATLTSSNLSSVSGGLGGEVSSLNSNLSDLKENYIAGTNIDSITKQGVHNLSGASGMYGSLIVTNKDNTYINQMFVQNDGLSLKARNSNNGGTTWGNWIEYAQISKVANEVKVGTLQITTDANGYWSGAVEIDSFGLNGSDLLSAYCQRGSLNAFRNVEVNMYGNNGYSFHITETTSKTPVANTTVTLTIVYIKH